MASELDAHLLGAGPKRLLALDGGGTRGIIELAFLERIEELLRAHYSGNPDFRLCQWFDLIGGTSTGAIIASALAIGMPVADVKKLYFDLAPRAFRRSRWRLPGLAARYDSKPLASFLAEHFGTRALDDDGIRTGLAMVARRFDTGSPWLISNIPTAPYWNDPADGSFIGNRHYRLADMIAASAAAPGYFRPLRLPIAHGQPHGLFVDGGLSPYNNPSLQLLMLTQARAFGLQWKTGPEHLVVTSIGTGHHRSRYAVGARPPRTAGVLAFQSLMDTVSDGNLLAITLLQWFGETPSPWTINSEIGDLSGEVLGGTPLLKFQRYDMPLEASWLLGKIGLAVSPRDLAELRRLDNPGAMSSLHHMAAQAALEQVQLSHLL